jgi:hypothetical protein
LLRSAAQGRSSCSVYPEYSIMAGGCGSNGSLVCWRVEVGRGWLVRMGPVRLFGVGVGLVGSDGWGGGSQ